MIIRDNVGMMPGGIIYEDPRTPQAKWLDDHTFVPDRVNEIISFRLANPGIYPEPEWTETKFVTKQVVEFNCRRIGFNGDYCIESNPPAPAPVFQESPKTCPDDGEVLVPKYCPTCSGKRLTGYECPKCHKEYSR